MGDKLQWFKYIVRQCSVRAGKTATFMPKPLFGDNGSGMHCHFSIWKGKSNLFAGSGYAGLSDTGKWAIGACCATRTR
jgi:glutamine synthetase